MIRSSTSLREHPRSRGTIEAEASKIVQNRSLPVPVEDIARDHGIEVVYSDLEGSTSGMLVRRPDGQAFIVVNRGHHGHRRRFTIAHELGHFFLHQESASIFVDGMRYDFRSEARTDLDPREREANIFAAALLMPEELVRHRVESEGGTVDPFDDGRMRGLTDAFGTSAQALAIRLEELGLLAGHS